MWFCMFYLGFYVRFDAPQKDAPVSGAGYAALVFVYLFAAAFQFGWGMFSNPGIGGLCEQCALADTR